MSEENEDIDFYFKEVIEPSEMEPSNMVWNTLEQKLDKKRFIILEKKITRLTNLTIGLSTIVIVLITLQLNRNFIKPNGFDAKIGARNIDIPNFPKIHNEVSKEQIDNTSNSKELLDKKSNNRTFNKLKSNSTMANSNTNISKVTYTDTSDTNNRTINDKGNSTLKENIVLNGFAFIPTAKINNTESNKNATSPSLNLFSLKDSTLNNKKTTDTTVFNFNPLGTILNNSTKKMALVNKSTKIDSIIKTTDSSISNNPSNKINTSKLSFRNKFSLIALFSPEFNASYLSDNNINDKRKSSYYSDNEAPDFSYTAGLKIGYSASKYWNIYSGLTFSSISSIIKPRYLYVNQTSNGELKYILNTSSGEVYLNTNSSARAGDSVKTASKTIQQLQFISIPLLCQYQVSRKRFNYYMFAGVSANIFIAGKTEVSYENLETESTTKIEGLRKVYFSGVLGVGVHYKISSKVSILTEPTFKRAINSINKSTPVNSYPYSFGLSFGLIYHF